MNGFRRFLPGASASRVEPQLASLEVKDLVAGYGKAKVLDGLSLSAAPGAVLGLAGPNGAGKTTLLKVLSAAVPLMGGSVRFGGLPLSASESGTSTSGVARVPEGRRLLANLTVKENLQLGSLGARRPSFDDELTDVIELLPGVEPLLSRRAGLLSGGQQQLCAVARGLIAHPSLLLIDELTLGLSPKTAGEVAEATTRSCRARGATVLWVDQNVPLLSQYCDEVHLLTDGRTRLLTEAEGRSSDVYFDHS